MDLFHHIFMGCTNIMGHEPLKIHGKFIYYAYMIIPLNSHDYFHGNFMAFGLVVNDDRKCTLAGGRSWTSTCCLLASKS